MKNGSEGHCTNFLPYMFYYFCRIDTSSERWRFGFLESSKRHIRDLVHALPFLLVFGGTRETGISLNERMQGENDSTSMPRGNEIRCRNPTFCIHRFCATLSGYMKINNESLKFCITSKSEHYLYR